ncbi:hypothetical protein GJAV_G00223840 [Gymnothorax javanicus]|nr:hypothetical protein GJAV_G00223840 [Gymnothorax javanicus]
MKPDGVATAVMEPMDGGAEPVMEEPPAGEEPGQDSPPSQPGGEEGPGPQEAAPPAAKAGSGGKAGEAKGKAKGPLKTKPGAKTATGTTGPGSRPGTAQNRNANGVQKSLTNGVPKKPSTTAPEKKKAVPSATPPKRPVGTATTKMADRKPAGAVRPASSPAATNGPKPATGASPANKKTTVGPSGDAKTKTPAPKTAGPRPASSTASKTGTTAATKPDRPPVSKTTRPATASPASRPTSTSTATKTTPSAKPAPSRLGATTPSAGRTASTLSPKPTTPGKKDVSKPTTPAAKKTSATPTRPTPTRASKPDTPKTTTTPAKQDSAAKKPTPGPKAADGKPARKPEAKSAGVGAGPRTTETKSKTATTPNTKKAVGSSTPVAVKRTPKAAQPATEKEEPQKQALEKEPKENEAPQKEVPQLEAPQKETPELEALQMETPQLEALQKDAPQSEAPPLEALQIEAPQLAAVQMAAPPKECGEGLLGILTGAGAAISGFAIAMVAAEPPAKTAVSPEVPPRQDTPPLISDIPVAMAADLLDEKDDAPSAPPLAADVPSVDLVAISAPALGTTVLSPPSSPLGPTLAPALSPTYVRDDHSPSLPSPGSGPDNLAQSAVKQPWEAESPEESPPPEGDNEPINWNTEMRAEPQVAAHTNDFAEAALHSLVQEKEKVVEKADEEINEDVEDEEEEEREPVSVSEMSGTTQPTDESRAGSAGLAGSAWRGTGGALLSELDSEDVSGSQQGASEMSAPGLLEGTESTDDLGDASLKGAEGDGASASSPDIETVPEIPTNEDEEEEDEEEEEEDRVYDMDVSSERAEDPRRSRQEEEGAEDEEEDEDVEMASEGVTESGLESYGNADEDDFAEEDRLDNLNRAPLGPPVPPAGPWAQSANPFVDPWAAPPELNPAHAISPLPDRWAVNPGIPTPPSQAWLDLGADPPLLQADEPLPDAAAQSTPPAQSPPPLPPPVVGMSQSSTLSGRELAARSSSETSTPEELRDYDSSSGVESRSEDKQETPVPQPAQPDAEQDLGIHLERGDGDEEEEAGEMHPAAEGEEGGEDEDGGTPQSANSAASYVFDITSASNNSNAHSAAESCGRSPGIFSLENEDQLPEEAKDPSLIKELTLPAAAPVDLLPLDDQPGDPYTFGGKLGVGEGPVDHAEPEVGALEAPETQPPYYSAICDKTENFLAGLPDEVGRAVGVGCGSTLEK